MTHLALDTNAYRALEDGNSAVVEAVRAAESIGLPMIVLGELYFGFENGTRKVQNVTKLDKFLATGRVELLPIDKSTARIFGEIFTELMRLGKPIQQDDVWIAALCKQHGYTLVTADKGFVHIVGLDVMSFKVQNK